MDRIDEILCDWHEWQAGYTPKLWHGGADPACRGFQSSRQWMDYDELNEEVERELKGATGRLVEPLVMALETRLRLAVNTAVRNLSAGAEVFRNPRYPETQGQDYAAAKAILCPQLVFVGLLEKSACVPA